MSYWFRMCVEHGNHFWAFAMLVAVCIMYSDMKGFIEEQTKALQAVSTQLTELNIRVSNIEHK